MPVDPLSLAVISNGARILLPFAGSAIQSWFTGDNEWQKKLAECGISILGNLSATGIENFLAQTPDFTQSLANQHFARYTGQVIGALIKVYAQARHQDPHQKDLLQLGTHATEQWLAYLRRGASGTQPLREKEFIERIAQQIHSRGEAPQLKTVPFLPMLQWASAELQLDLRLDNDALRALESHLQSQLGPNLHSALVADDPQAEAAYKETTLQLFVGIKDQLKAFQAELLRQGRNQDFLAPYHLSTHAMLVEERDSPGFDIHRYAERLRHHCDLIPLSDKGGSETRDALRLSTVFVPPSVRAIQDLAPDDLEIDADTLAAVQQGHMDRLPADKRPHAERLRNLLREQPARPAAEIIRDPTQRAVIFLGDAGVGKTSLMRHLALEWTEALAHHVPGQSLPPIPLLIELRRYYTEEQKQPGFQLLDYLHRCENGIDRLDKAWCRHYLQTGQAILILDGLDEVPDHTVREAIANGATRLVQQGAKVIVTSRRVGFIQEHWLEQIQVTLPMYSGGSYAPLWERHLLQEFDDSQRTRFIDQMHRLLYAIEVERQERTATFQQRLQQFPAIERLTRNPLLLTLATLLHRRSALGDNRVDLYEEASIMLLDEWEQRRTPKAVQPGSQHLQPLTKDVKVRIVRRLARRVLESADQAHLGENLFPIDLLQDAVRTVLDPKDENPNQTCGYVDLMPGLLRERHSLLCLAGHRQLLDSKGKPKAGKSIELFSFIHRSFLEFFAAQAWAKDKDLGGLAPDAVRNQFLLGLSHGLLPRWQDERFANILPLYYGQLSDDRLQDRLPLLQALWEDPQPDETSRHQAILFAASCFIEVKSREEHHDFSQALQQQLFTLAQTSWEQRHRGDPKAEPQRERCRRAVRALVQLWGAEPAIDTWLWHTLTDRPQTTTLRGEVGQQLLHLQGPCERLLAALQHCLLNPEEDAYMCQVAFRLLNDAWGAPTLLDSLDKLQSLPHLTRLYLNDCTTLHQVPDLSRLHGLATLSLGNGTGLQGPDAFGALTGLKNLKHLFLNGCNGLTDLRSLELLSRLEWLDLRNCTGLQGAGVLEPLGGLERLWNLNLNGCTGLTDLHGLGHLGSLQLLDLQNCTGLQGAEVLEPMIGLDQLQALQLDGCTGITREQAEAFRQQVIARRGPTGQKLTIYGP